MTENAQNPQKIELPCSPKETPVEQLASTAQLMSRGRKKNTLGAGKDLVGQCCSSKQVLFDGGGAHFLCPSLFPFLRNRHGHISAHF